MLQRLEARITVEQQRLSIAFTRTELASLLDSSIDDDEAVTLTADVMFKPRGHELRLVYAAPDARPTVRDDHLIRLLANAWRGWQQLKDGQASGPERRQLPRAARLTFLAPDITMAILEGRQPVELTARSLLRVADLSHDWREQLRVLGFKAI